MSKLKHFKTGSIVSILMIALLAIFASGCKKDDAGTPKLELDRGTMKAAFGGQVIDLGVDSNTSWETSAEAEDDDTEWFTLTPTSGDGKKTISVEVTPNPTFGERAATIKVFTLDKKIVRELKLTQEGKPVPATPISISALRDNAKNALMGNETSYLIKDHIKITGTIVSDPSTKHLGNKYIVIQDSDQKNSGILVHLAGTNDNNVRYTFGQVVEVELRGASIVYTNPENNTDKGGLMIQTRQSNVKVDIEGTPKAYKDPITINPEEIADYEFMYVNIDNTEFLSLEDQTVWNNGSNARYRLEYWVDWNTSEDKPNISSTHLMLFVTSTSTFANNNNEGAIQKSGNIKALVFNEQNGVELRPIRVDAFDGLTEERFGVFTVGMAYVNKALVAGRQVLGDDGDDNNPEDDTYIVIPYYNAKGGEQYAFKLSLDDSQGLTLDRENVTGSISGAGEGKFTIKLSGTPLNAIDVRCGITDTYDYIDYDEFYLSVGSGYNSNLPTRIHANSQAPLPSINARYRLLDIDGYEYDAFVITMMDIQVTGQYAFSGYTNDTTGVIPSYSWSEVPKKAKVSFYAAPLDGKQVKFVVATTSEAGLIDRDSEEFGVNNPPHLVISNGHSKTFLTPTGKSNIYTESNLYKYKYKGVKFTEDEYYEVFIENFTNTTPIVIKVIDPTSDMDGNIGNSKPLHVTRLRVDIVEE